MKRQTSTLKSLRQQKCRLNVSNIRENFEVGGHPNRVERIREIIGKQSLISQDKGI